MSDQEFQLPRPGAEGAFQISAAYKGHTLPLTVDEATLRRELQDQSEVKKPARKAILRASEKRLAKQLKAGPDKLGPQARDAFDWDLFILTIDSTIADRHLQIRENPALIDEILKEAALQPAG